MVLAGLNRLAPDLLRMLALRITPRTFYALSLVCRHVAKIYISDNMLEKMKRSYQYEVITQLDPLKCLVTKHFPNRDKSGPEEILNEHGSIIYKFYPKENYAETWESWGTQTSSVPYRGKKKHGISRSWCGETGHLDGLTTWMDGSKEGLSRESIRTGGGGYLIKNYYFKGDSVVYFSSFLQDEPLTL